MDSLDEDFKKFMGYLLFLGFLTMFWNGFKADMEKRSNASTIRAKQIVQPVQQKVYRRVYVNNGMGPATVYYVQQ